MMVIVDVGDEKENRDNRIIGNQMVGERIHQRADQIKNPTQDFNDQGGNGNLCLAVPAFPLSRR